MAAPGPIEKGLARDLNFAVKSKTPSDKERPLLFDVDKIEKIKIDELVEQTKNKIDLINKSVLSGEMSILDSTVEMGKLTREALEKVAEKFAAALNIDVQNLPFAIFVFGATARNQMLPNSDLDIGLVFEDNCPAKIKSSVKDIVSILPFNDETDIAHWDSIDSMRKENCPSMMEYNKVMESRFVAGNIEMGNQHDSLAAQQDTRIDKEKRFITEYGLLHKFDYRSRGSEHGANLKYDFGASRDIVFLDWYYLLSTIGETPPEDHPTSFACLDLLLGNGTITSSEYDEMKSGLELILLVKFALWSKNAESGDKKLLYLSDYSLDAAYEDIEKIIKKTGINNTDEFAYAYNKARAALRNLIETLFQKVASSHEDLMEIWRMAKEKEDLDEEVLNLLKHPTWNELVPFAVSSASPQILNYIVKQISNLEGYEYILRIISENKYITDDIRRNLLDSRLDKRFKKKIDVESRGNI